MDINSTLNIPLKKKLDEDGDDNELNMTILVCMNTEKDELSYADEYMLESEYQINLADHKD